MPLIRLKRTMFPKNKFDFNHPITNADASDKY